MKRRKFIKKTILGATSSTIIPMTSSGILFNACQEKKPTSTVATTAIPAPKEKELQISLAQWSLHRGIENQEVNPADFAQIASKDFGINALEYVASFYKEHTNDESYWQDLNQRAKDLSVKNLLVMVDNEGDLGDQNDETRKTAVENHYKWINAAKLLNCHSIRVNAFGSRDKTVFKNALIAGLGSLSEYAGKENINILIENHGLFSSEAAFIVDIIKELNMPNLGTLPDFGNWCTSAQWGNTMIPCDEIYDRYKGVSEYLPYAKGVSAKSYNFNEQGEDRIIDYHKMLKIVKDSDFEGYIGIEYEGDELSESEGIKTTKALLEKAWQDV